MSVSVGVHRVLDELLGPSRFVPGVGRSMGNPNYKEISAMIGNCLTRDVRLFLKTDTLAGLGQEAIALVSAMREWGWTPVDSDVKVQSWGMRTGIDLVATARDGTVILIELKTGSKDTFVSNTAINCRRPFGFIESYPVNRALVQALLTKYCAVADGKLPQSAEVAVIHVDRADVSLFTAKSRPWYKDFERMTERIVQMIGECQVKVCAEKIQELQRVQAEATQPLTGTTPSQKRRRRTEEDSSGPVLWTVIARRQKARRRKPSAADASVKGDGDAKPRKKQRRRRSTPPDRQSKGNSAPKGKPSRKCST